MKTVSHILFAFVMLTSFGILSPAISKEEVDVQLVLAVDISYSMDERELELQRQGYIAAITSPEVMAAIKSGLLGRIAVSYMEWAGAEQQYIVADWHIIETAEDAAQFAEILEKAPMRRAYRTSISGALAYAATLFGRSPYQGMRQVIDMSGDGPNNSGPAITYVRDAVLAQGIAINGLPLFFDEPEESTAQVDLEGYYRDCVIGGVGSFLIPVRGVEAFPQAVRTKMVLEIAGISPEPTIKHAAGSRMVPCVAGEAMWQQP